MAIAAARLGLSVATVGNMPLDVYGRFLKDTLQVCASKKSQNHDMVVVAWCTLEHVHNHLSLITAYVMSGFKRLCVRRCAECVKQEPHVTSLEKGARGSLYVAALSDEVESMDMHYATS